MAIRSFLFNENCKDFTIYSIKEKFYIYIYKVPCPDCNASYTYTGPSKISTNIRVKKDKISRI